MPFLPTLAVLRLYVFLRPRPSLVCFSFWSLRKKSRKKINKTASLLPRTPHTHAYTLFLFLSLSLPLVRAYRAIKRTRALTRRAIFVHVYVNVSFGFSSNASGNSAIGAADASEVSSGCRQYIFVRRRRRKREFVDKFFCVLSNVLFLFFFFFKRYGNLCLFLCNMYL